MVDGSTKAAVVVMEEQHNKADTMLILLCLVLVDMVSFVRQGKQFKGCSRERGLGCGLGL